MTSWTPQIPEHPDFLFRRPGALIAAIPAMLGFVPERSLIVVTLQDGVIGAVLRRDLEGLDDPSMAAVAQMLHRSDSETVIAVVVGTGSRGPDIVDRLAEHLEPYGVSLLAGHLVDRIAAGGQWTCADGCGAGGPVDDPKSSPLAVAAVVEGRQVLRNRDELAALLHPSDRDRSAALEKVLRRKRTQAANTDPVVRDRRDVRRVINVVYRVGIGAPLSDRDVVAVARALCAIRVRDAVYALSVGALAAEAESLWTRLSRILPAPWRAETLVLLGYSAYARGDGPLAGLALDAALAVDPAHRMGRMLMTALQSGMRPVDIRTLADTGFEIAHELGVLLPSKETRRAG